MLGQLLLCLAVDLNVSEEQTRRDALDVKPGSRIECVSRRKAHEASQTRQG